MSQRRMAFAWIACFAVLFNMLAMPLSGAAPKTASEQVVWGSFCTASGTKLVAISLGKADHSAPHNDDHSTMQHCWCCSGSAPLVAIPASFATWYATRIENTANPFDSFPRAAVPAPAMAEPQSTCFSTGLIQAVE